MKLTEIKSPADVKTLGINELSEICSEIRKSLLMKLSRYGGHVGPNLGMVEMTVALHYVFDYPQDKIVYDVSHQSYVHKMLTGRMKAFTDPAEYDTVTGFTNPAESPADIFTIGHTSTGVSLAGGLVKARNLTGGTERVVAVVGDGSLSGGEAFEGLNVAATLRGNFVIVVNDNDMSIAENHGGLYENLKLLRDTDGNAPLNYFKALGLDYRYVAYGNDLKSLIDAFEEVKDLDHPVVVHVYTQKGKGFAPAEVKREEFHFSGPFDIHSGQMLHADESADYGDITAEHLLKMMKEDPSVLAITAGTPGVIGFTPEHRHEAGKQFEDVGIAEQEAVALASGVARGGGKPFFGVVSSFVQRAYDQLSQDMAINGSPAVIGIFYGSVLGMNDVTHLGWFDIALISNIPNIVFLAPTCRQEYLAMLDWGMRQNEHPVVIKLPGGAVIDCDRKFETDYDVLNRYETVRKGSKVALIGAGTFFKTAMDAADLLKDAGIEATVINPRYLSDLDCDTLESLKKDHTLVVTIEDGILDGGWGEKIARYYGPDPEMMVKCYGLEKKFVDRYDRKTMLEDNHLTAAQISQNVKELLK